MILWIHSCEEVLLGFLFQGSSKSGGESTDSGSAVNTLSSKADLAEAQLEPESPISKKASSSDHQAFDQKHLQQFQQQQLHQEMASDTSRTGTSQNQSAAGKAPMDKVLKLQFLTVNLPVLSLTISPKLGKKLVSLLLLLLFCSLFHSLSLSLALEHIFIYNSTDPNNSQKINKVQSFPDF